jgi:DNA-binding HxlR family transcriptional regulator
LASTVFFISKDVMAARRAFGRLECACFGAAQLHFECPHQWLALAALVDGSSAFEVCMASMHKPVLPVEAIETALKVVGGKWKILILTHLVPGTKRFGELKKLMPQITEKMLIQQLRELEADGLIERKTFGSVPPRVEYSFSMYGHSLRTVIEELAAWGVTHCNRTDSELAHETAPAIETALK